MSKEKIILLEKEQQILINKRDEINNRLAQIYQEKEGYVNVAEFCLWGRCNGEKMSIEQYYLKYPFTKEEILTCQYISRIVYPTENYNTINRTLENLCFSTYNSGLMEDEVIKTLDFLIKIAGKDLVLKQPKDVMNRIMSSNHVSLVVKQKLTLLSEL